MIARPAIETRKDHRLCQDTATVACEPPSASRSLRLSMTGRKALANKQSRDVVSERNVEWAITHLCSQKKHIIQSPLGALVDELQHSSPFDVDFLGDMYATNGEFIWVDGVDFCVTRLRFGWANYRHCNDALLRLQRSTVSIFSPYDMCSFELLCR